MIGLELTALGIVALFVAVRARFGPEPRRFLLRLGLLVVTSWVAENSAIRAYGFYSYSPKWSLFVDRVPLAILLIWPVVIHSAWELCGHLWGKEARWLPLLGGAMVLCDASLIEPIAVASGLWWWTEPGLFSVPPIGLCGWAYHAGLCMAVLEQNRRAERAPLADAAMILLAPLGTHALLLASWWGLFRWISAPLAPWPFVALAWTLSIGLTVASLGAEARKRVPPLDMLTRVPAALFFLGLLVAYGGQLSPLWAYALAFAPPYVSLTRLPGAIVDRPTAA